jgi:hypothetical protein
VTGGRKAWIEPGLLLLISLSVTILYSLTDGSPLFWDEYYHLLAARSWAENGTLAVGDGVYGRGAWLSVIVGRLFRSFGESIFIARLPGALALSTWALAVFLFVRGEVGRIPAWIASLALCLSPVVMINSVMVRFYGFAGLSFWVGCACAFLAASKSRPLTRRLPFGLIALVTLRLTFEITPLARLWIACLMLWLLGVGLFEAARSRRRLEILGGAILIGVIAGIWAFQTGWLTDLWHSYRSVPGWALDRGRDIRWYENLIRGDYPTLWTLLPLAAMLTLVRHPRVGTLSVTVFGVGVILLSLGGAKAGRYFIPILPFFFVLWGTAVAQLIAPLQTLLSSVVSPFRSPSVPSSVPRLAERGLMALVFAFVLLTNPGFSRVRHMLRDDAVSLYRGPWGIGVSVRSWELTARVLRPLMRESDIVVTSNSVQTLYHIGDYDFAMRPTVISEVRPREDFGMDLRTGRPAISTVESLNQLVTTHTHGLVFGERWRWNHPVEGFTQEVTDYVMATMEQVPLDEDLGVIAFRW